MAQEDQVNCAVILLKNGAEVDPPSKAGYTPLHVACHYGNHKTAAFLLNHGAAIDAKTKVKNDESVCDHTGLPHWIPSSFLFTE